MVFNYVRNIAVSKIGFLYKDSLGVSKFDPISFLRMTERLQTVFALMWSEGNEM